MEKTMEIKGMMCGHCEVTVKKALEKIEGVEEAIVSHEQGTAIVKMSEEVSDELLKQVVEDRDYEVVKDILIVYYNEYLSQKEEKIKHLLTRFDERNGRFLIQWK